MLEVRAKDEQEQACLEGCRQRWRWMGGRRSQGSKIQSNLGRAGIPHQCCQLQSEAAAAATATHACHRQQHCWHISGIPVTA